MKNTFFLTFILFVQITFSQTNQLHHNSNDWNSSRPDGHAPISVMGDHTHHKGGFMASFINMDMTMNKMMMDDNLISNSEIFKNYMVSPNKMNMNMKMFGLMYAISNKVTIMSMFPLIEKDMFAVTKMGIPFSTSSRGLGDIKISAIYNFSKANKLLIVGQLGVSFPTGGINQMDITPSSKPNQSVLTYPMQLGSGSFELLSGLVINKQFNNFSFGVQPKIIVPLNNNNNDYKNGSEISILDWVSYKVSDWISLSVSTKYQHISKITGYDTRLDKMMTPSANSINSGGKFFFYGIGSNFYVPKGKFKNLRFQIEFEIPLSVKYNGVQMSNEKTSIFGVQYSW